MDCDAVVHTACIYGRGSETAAEVHAANVEFAQQVLEASALAGVPLFIACDTTLPPEVSAYAAAKAAFRQILAQSIAPPVRIALRLEHMYGPADGDKKLVTFLIRALLSNLPRIPLSAGTQLRDFVHISDVLEGIALLLSAGLQGRCLPLLPSSARHPVPALPPGFNEFTLGSGEAIRIRELAEHIKSLIPESGSVLGFGDFPLRPQEVMRSVSPSPELRALGWAPQVPLREGLAALVSHERSLFTPRA
jgi:nucleoside-diphosphate-sugar epimerase